ncbi:hypothetical protein CC78DRAFT_586645 [Lojkania enalia]|uniref:CDAN1-interacting nuclease 1 n=1 Tax=Lojkania enalia TaxID=147567 RepID=A0A9P4JX80_9PLEO|nr:hypothetical protein CC78DRAFT_586645 [Didymosphaeria enalia]
MALDQHKRDSPIHKHDCKTCDCSFANGTALAQHLQNSSVHASSFAVPYNGIPASEIRPVYQVDLKLRHSNPEPRRIIELTRTTLETRIVSAIIDGALRLLPPDQDPAREAIRMQKIRDRTERASQAEKLFNMRHSAGNEVVQKTKITPDILFSSPTIVHGVLCHWIEYKDTFGFKQNPFVHKQHLKQFRKYATTLGSGMVVYSVGFESELLRVEGVTCFREAEVMGWLDSKISQRQYLARVD